MDLDFIKLDRGHMKHFTAQDEALLIDDAIYVKGPSNYLLRVPIEQDDDLNECSTVPLPIGAPGEESIISTVSPINRVANLYLDLDGKKVIP